MTASVPGAKSTVWLRLWRGSSGWLGASVAASSGVVGLRRRDRGRQMPVVEQRGVVGEALDAHQLLGVQAAVGAPELGVPLARDLADLAVVGHDVLLSCCGLSASSDKRTSLSCHQTIR